MPSDHRKTNLGILKWATRLFPASKIDSIVLDAYADETSDIDPARLELALKAVAKKQEFWPSLNKIREAERLIGQGNEDEKIFRQAELALIALNEELKGGVLGDWNDPAVRESYLAKRKVIKDAAGITEEQLEQAKVYKPDKSGFCPDPELTWGQLESRRRLRDQRIQEIDLDRASQVSMEPRPRRDLDGPEGAE